MKCKRSAAPDPSALRQQAERRLRAQQRRAERPPSPGDARALLHELQVHQIELEMQNESLQRAQIEAQQGADKYAELFDFAPVGYFVLDARGAIREVNLAGAALFGLDRQRVTGRPFEPHLAPDSRAGFRELLRRVRAGEGQRSCEVRLLGPGQGLCDALVKASPAANEAGPTRSCLLAVTDVTDRKQAEDALRESEERMQAALAAAHAIAWELDLAGGVLLESGPVEEFFGKPAGFRHGTDAAFFESIHPEDRAEVRAQVARAVQGTGSDHSVEFRVLLPDGAVRWVASSGSIERDAAGRPVRLRGICRDITARKQAEAALARTHRALRVLAEGNHALIRATNEQELLHEACRIAVELGGYKMAWVGYAEHDARKSIRPVAQFGVAKDYIVRATVTWADTRNGRGPAGVAIRTGRPCACRDVAKDPRFAPWRREALKRGYASALALPLLPAPDFMGVLAVYAAQPVAFADSEVQVLQQLANDLSFGIMALRGREDRRRLERQVLEIGESVRLRIGQDLHDGLGQSLTGIHYLIGAVQQALVRKGAPEAAELQRIGALVGQSVGEAHALALGLFPVELGKSGLAAAMQELAAQTQDVFGVSCRFRGRTTVRLADESVARQVFRIAQEAVNNAVKHSKGKAVEIRLSRRQGRLVLTVRDTGRGMPRRVSRTAGMGQRIMKYRADTIGALLRIESARGKGTTVTCVFPPEPTRPAKRPA